MDMKNLVEVLLFASPKPLTQKHIALVMEDDQSVDMKTVVDELNAEYEQAGKGLKIREIGRGYQILSLPE